VLRVNEIKKRFVASYILALGLIILACVMSHLASMRVIAAESGAAEIVNISGKQRMLSQRTLALVEARSGDRASTFQSELLQTTLEELRAANTQLNAEARAVRYPEIQAALQDVFNHETRGINVLLTEFTALAEQALIGPVSAPDRTRMENLANGTLYAGLNRAVSEFEAAAEQGLSQIAQIQLVHLFSVLLILVAEALFIFAPLLKRTLKALTDAYHARQAAEDALTLQAEAVESKHRFMQNLRQSFLQPLADAQRHMELAAEADPLMAPDEIRKALTALEHADQRARSFRRSHAEWMQEQGVDGEGKLQTG